MSGLIPYLLFPGDAAEALQQYAAIFGGELQMFTYAQAGRTDGPEDAIAHGMLVNGPVELAGADAANTSLSTRPGTVSKRAAAVSSRDAPPSVTPATMRWSSA